MMGKTYTLWRAILIAGMAIRLAGRVDEMVWSGDKGKPKGAEVIAIATFTKITIGGAVETASTSTAVQAMKRRIQDMAYDSARRLLD